MRAKVHLHVHFKILLLKAWNATCIDPSDPLPRGWARPDGPGGPDGPDGPVWARLGPENEFGG